LKLQQIDPFSFVLATKVGNSVSGVERKSGTWEKEEN